jgi:hypothetical protein
MNHELRVELLISDFDCHPDQITEQLGIAPTTIRLKGVSYRADGKMIARHNRWILTSGVDTHADFETQLNDLLEKIIPNLNQFALLPQNCYIELSIILYMYSGSEASIPAIHFTTSQQKMIEKIQATIDIDLYILPND